MLIISNTKLSNSNIISTNNNKYFFGFSEMQLIKELLTFPEIQDKYGLKLAWIFFSCDGIFKKNISFNQAVYQAVNHIFISLPLRIYFVTA